MDVPFCCFFQGIDTHAGLHACFLAAALSAWLLARLAARCSLALLLRFFSRRFSVEPLLSSSFNGCGPARFDLLVFRAFRMFLQVLEVSAVNCVLCIALLSLGLCTELCCVWFQAFVLAVTGELGL